MRVRELNLSGCDLDYVELRSLSFGELSSAVECEISCPRIGWYWIEKWNKIRRFFGLSVKREGGVLLNLKLSEVLEIIGDLPSAIASGVVTLPLDLDNLS